MPRKSRVEREQLRFQMAVDFRFVAALEGMTPEVKAVAWGSAIGRLGTASACYRSIAASYGYPPIEPAVFRRQAV